MRSIDPVVEAALAPVLIYGLGVAALLLVCLMPMCCWCCRTPCWRPRQCCPCFKQAMRCTGVDKFDDFEVMILVHEAHLTYTKGKPPTRIRVVAGSQVVETDVSQHGIFQQSLLLLVEQGTREISVDLLTESNRRLAVLKLDPLKDILQRPGGVHEKSFAMRAQHSAVGNPRVLLTMQPEKSGDEEQCLLQSIAVHSHPHTAQQQFALRQHLEKVGWDDQLPAEAQLDQLVRACEGPVEWISGWAGKTPGYLAVKRPPERRRFVLGIWRDQHDCEANGAGAMEVELMKVSGVRTDPGRQEVFVVTYVDSNRVRTQLALRRLDRCTDVWVDILTLLIEVLRDMKDRQRPSPSVPARHTMAGAPSCKPPRATVHGTKTAK